MYEGHPRYTLLLWGGSLLGLLSVQHLTLLPSDHSPASIGMLLVIAGPLLTLIPVIVGASVQGLFWASFVAMGYVVYGVVQVADPASRLIGLLEIIAAISLFISCLMQLRTPKA